MFRTLKPFFPAREWWWFKEKQCNPNIQIFYEVKRGDVTCHGTIVDDKSIHRGASEGHISAFGVVCGKVLRDLPFLHWSYHLEALLESQTSRFLGHQHKKERSLRWHPLGRLYRPEREVVWECGLAVHWSRREWEMTAFDLLSLRRVCQSEMNWSTAEAHHKWYRLLNFAWVAREGLCQTLMRNQRR